MNENETTYEAFSRGLHMDENNTKRFSKTNQTIDEQALNTCKLIESRGIKIADPLKPSDIVLGLIVFTVSLTAAWLGILI